MFWGLSILLSVVFATFYVSPKSLCEPLFFTSSSILVIVTFLVLPLPKLMKRMI
jgi:hypothetical protein